MLTVREFLSGSSWPHRYFYKVDSSLFNELIYENSLIVFTSSWPVFSVDSSAGSALWVNKKKKKKKHNNKKKETARLSMLVSELLMNSS